MDTLVGHSLGAYRLLALIRRDGVTTVYRAQEPSTGRVVAVVLLSPTLVRNGALRERLHHETPTLTQLEHAHIVPLYDYGRIDGHSFLVMGYVEGGTLRERLSESLLSPSEVQRITSHVGAALDYAHRLGIVHGDVRPGNVLLDPDGTALLTGFGLTHIVGAGRGPGWLGMGVGAPAYASPERARGEPLEPRSDIYSLGMMLYEMATGGLPHTAETPLGLALKYAEELPPSPRTLQPGLSQNVERVILKALAPEPEQRFQTAGEMTQALDEALQTAGAAPARHPDPALKERLPLLPEWRGLLPLAGTVAVVLLFILALSRLPLRVQIAGGQLEVVRVVEQTAAPISAVGEMETAVPASLAPGTMTIPGSEPPSSLPSSTPSATLAPVVITPPLLTATPASFPTTTPLPPVVSEEARAFAEPILASIAERPPDFSTDFEPGDPEWRWEVVSTDPEDARFEIVAGAARMELADRADVQLSHPRLEATDFVLSVESRQISGASGSEQKIFLHFASTYLQFMTMSGTRHWGLALPWHPEGGFGGQGMVVHPMGETNRTLMVVRGPELAVYLNDVPVTYLREPNLDTLHRIAFWCTGAPDIVCEFDNVQFWDLAD